MHNNGSDHATRFLALLRPIERDLETYCRRLIWQPDEAADAIQNAVLRAYKAFDRYREEARFRAWMFKILTREAFALNRKHARISFHEVQVDRDALSGFAGDDIHAFAEELEAEVSAALRRLTDTERAVLLLRAIGGLSYKEIADNLDIPLGSVMGSLARARSKMQTMLKRKTCSKESCI
jgi:RNA polymerase sigma-70 factor (ECF subfamily)